jgi:hypothetical protein
VRRSETAFAGGALLLCLLGPTPTAAAADADTERARALYEEAGELERQGQWSTAQERIRGALRLKETPQLHYALGWALENDDKLLEAKLEYESAARLSRERPGAEEAARLAAARLIDLERKMPAIRVRVVGSAKASVRVIVDGRELRREDDVATTTVNPGSHVIRVERGPERFTEEIAYVGRSSVRTVDIDGSDSGAWRDTTQDRHGVRAAAPSKLRPAAAHERADGVLPWLLLSGGLVLTGGGTALLVAGAPDANQEAAGIVIGGVGIVGTTIGAILLLRGGANGERTDKPAPRTRASVSPLPGGAIAGAAFAF